MRTEDEIREMIVDIKISLKNWENDFEIEPRLPKLKYNQTRGYLAALYWMLDDTTNE